MNVEPIALIRRSRSDNEVSAFKWLGVDLDYRVVPAAAKRRAGTHSRAFPNEVPEWV